MITKTTALAMSRMSRGGYRASRNNDVIGKQSTISISKVYSQWNRSGTCSISGGESII